MKKLFLLLMLACFLLLGCSQTKPANTLRVGVMQNQQLEIINYIKTLAQKENLAVQVIEFEDYIEINSALKQKTIDVNCFQNQFYLEQVNKERNLDFVAVGKTYLAPLGLYCLNHLPANNATIAIPDDTFTLSRSLSLLDKAGLIKLQYNESKLYELSDILENTTNLQFKLVDSSQIRQELITSDGVILTFNYIEYVNSKSEASLSPLLQEDIDSNFVQLIVTRKELENDPKVKHFAKLYNSDEVKTFIKERYQNKLIPAW